MRSVSGCPGRKNRMGAIGAIGRDLRGLRGRERTGKGNFGVVVGLGSRTNKRIIRLWRVYCVYTKAR